jgi:hypothetical protein
MSPPYPPRSKQEVKPTCRRLTVVYKAFDNGDRKVSNHKSVRSSS